MVEATPSVTALRVAMRRAAHVLHDASPPVLNDPLALRMLPREAQDEVRYRTPRRNERIHSRALRAWVVARARFAEETLAARIATHAAAQYVVLGAGLDTFAWRDPSVWRSPSAISHAGVRVFEVDHPATQRWKRERLAAAGLDSALATLVPVDFERDDCGRQLALAGLQPDKPVVTAWLGVVPYLTEAAFERTLRMLAGFAPGSAVVFDYALPREALPPDEQRMRDSLSSRVAAAGEPFQLFMTPAALARHAQQNGLRLADDLDTATINARWFAGRGDGLRVLGVGPRLCCLEVASEKG